MLLRKLQAMKAKKGFTLIELIVVIAIIAVLAAILIPIMMNYMTNSRISDANSNASNVHRIIAASITDIETRGLAVPTDLTLVTAAVGGVWTVTGTDPVPTGGTNGVIKDRLDADLPNFEPGNGTITQSLDGAPLTLVWRPASNTAPVATFTAGAWSKDATRVDMFGVYPNPRG